MDSLRRIGLAVLGVCVFFVGATTAQADTYVLTSGGATTGDSVLGLGLSAPDFHLSVRTINAPARGPFIQGCPGPDGACTSGATITLDSTLNATAFTIGLPGSVVANGTTYPPFRFSGGSVTWLGSGIVPTLTDHDEAIFSLPFTMSGTMVGTNILGNLFIPPDPAETAIFNISFAASGMARVFLNEAHRPVFVTFDITSGTAQFDPVPVPEPTTILLLSTGLAGMTWLRRRRQSRR